MACALSFAQKLVRLVKQRHIGLVKGLEALGRFREREARRIGHAMRDPTPRRQARDMSERTDVLASSRYPPGLTGSPAGSQWFAVLTSSQQKRKSVVVLGGVRA